MHVMILIAIGLRNTVCVVLSRRPKKGERSCGRKEDFLMIERMKRYIVLNACYEHDIKGIRTYDKYTTAVY